jgi:hypothetical protein
MHATPTHSGWVEPLPILAGQSPLAAFPPAPGSRSRCPSGTAIRLSSPKRFLSERLYPHGSQSALRASLQSFVVAAPRRARSARNPCSLVSSRTSWPPSSPAPGSLRHCAWAGVPFGGSYPASRNASFILTDTPAGSGLSTVFAVVALHVPGLHATPVLYGRTEPPGRLPSCARLPLKVIGLPRLSPRLSGFRRGFFILTVPDPRWASLRPFAAVARGVLRSARYPCPFGLGQHLLAASIPAPGLSSRRVASPGVLSLFPRLRFPARDLSPHGSWTRDEPICHRLAVAVPRLAKVCKLPLHNFG